MVEFKPHDLLFKYYCEQSQHTENLLIQISKYYWNLCGVLAFVLVHIMRLIALTGTNYRRHLQKLETPPPHNFPPP